MDLETLKAKALAAREFTHAEGECKFRLRIPTRFDVLVTSSRIGAKLARDDATSVLLLQRGLLEASIVGWEGVRVGHIVQADDESSAPLAWEAGAVAALLDARPDWEQTLGDALSKAMAERRAGIEADAKN